MSVELALFMFVPLMVLIFLGTPLAFALMSVALTFGLWSSLTDSAYRRWRSARRRFSRASLASFDRGELGSPTTAKKSSGACGA